VLIRTISSWRAAQKAAGVITIQFSGWISSRIVSLQQDMDIQ